MEKGISGFWSFWGVWWRGRGSGIVLFCWGEVSRSKGDFRVMGVLEEG